MNDSQLLIVEYSIQFIEPSWNWLNDPEIKKLTNTPNFSKEDQINFFHSLPERKNYYIKGIVYNEDPIGACGLKNITDTDAEYWGYIGEKEYWGKGLGKQIMNKMIEKAKELNLSSIYLKVISDNPRAISLYKKIGFEIENESDGVFFMRLLL